MAWRLVAATWIAPSSKTSTAARFQEQRGLGSARVGSPAEPPLARAAAVASLTLRDLGRD